MKWKKKIAGILSVVFLSTSSAPAGNMLEFMEDTMESLTTITPHAYQGQERGYFIGGSASIRFPNENIQPFSFTPPQLKAGCGGIDIIMGGFSYLNFDYLVQKLQQILQVAPAFAFELALGTLCKDCKNILDSLDNLANQINQMNLNQCQTAKALAGYVGQKLGWISSKKQSGGESDGFFSAISDAIENFNNETRSFINRYSALYDGGDVEATFSFQPSLLHNAFEKAGAYTYLEPFVRALVGDWYETQAAEENTSSPTRINACPQATADAKELLDRLLEGSYWVKNINETTGEPFDCQPFSGESFTERIKNKIDCIGYKMKLSLGREAVPPSGCTGTSLSDEEISLINNIDIPIISFLKSSIVLDQDDIYQETLSKLTNVVALQVAYLSFSKITQLAKILLDNYQNQVSKLVLPEAAKPYFEELKNRMDELKREAYKRYTDELHKVRSEYGSFLQKQLELKLALYRALKQHNLLHNYLFQLRMERGQ
ncbi:conjugal transfer protein TraH [Desulfurobacterium crinifex]